MHLRPGGAVEQWVGATPIQLVSLAPVVVAILHEFDSTECVSVRHPQIDLASGDPIN